METTISKGLKALWIQRIDSAISDIDYIKFGIREYNSRLEECCDDAVAALLTAAATLNKVKTIDPFADKDRE